jgi:hypothetical protein
MTAPNTLSNQYLSVMSKTEACKADFNQIVRNCQPEPDEKTKKEDEEKGIKHKKSTLTTTIKESLKSLDDKGKELAGYNRDKVAVLREDRPFKGNAWIDDHCTGLWVTPFSAKKSTDEELKKFMEEMPGKLDESFSKLSDNLDSIWTQLDASLELMDEMVGVATDMGMGPVAESIGKKLAAKAAVKGGVGLLGIESVIIPILMALWTIADIAVAINDLASFMGDKGKAFLNTLGNLDKAEEKIAELAQDLKDKPMKGLTNTMRYAAELNPCIRARKCLLVPYKNTEKNRSDRSKAATQAKHGQGCCPGQTGHHIMPDSMFEGVDCPGYSYDDAPTMCLEGTSNSAGWGSHGDAHANLKTTMKHYRDTENERLGGDPDSISYDAAQKQGIDAVRKEAATQCDPDCLKAQLDDHYKQCKKKDGTSSNLLPSDGCGKFNKMKPDTTTPDDSPDWG